MPTRDARIDDALDEVGLARSATRPARVLSGGEQQRLALARAWALRPEVLFLDEPTASLDPAATRAVEAIVSDIHARGTTIVMTTHNLAQAKRLADDIVFLHGGPRRPSTRRRTSFSVAALARGRGISRRRTPVKRRSLLAMLPARCSLLAGRAAAGAQDKFIVVASTTSTEQSGLFGHLLPAFEKDTGIKVRVVARRHRPGARHRRAAAMPTSCSSTTGGGGEIRRRRASASSASRSCTTTSCWSARRAIRRRSAGGKDILEALRKVAAAQAPFVSRGDKSGTHAAELRYWKDAGVDLDAKKGAWYRDTGSGMGPTLNTASSMNAYVLTDRGTWLSFKNRGDLDDPRRRRQAALQPVRRDARQSRRSIRT